MDKAVWSCSTEDIINSIPPHWSEGSVNIPGAPIAGAAITSPSRRCANAPPLLTGDDRLSGIGGNDEF